MSARVSEGVSGKNTKTWKLDLARDLLCGASFMRYRSGVWPRGVSGGTSVPLRMVDIDDVVCILPARKRYRAPYSEGGPAPQGAPWLTFIYGPVGDRKVGVGINSVDYGVWFVCSGGINTHL